MDAKAQNTIPQNTGSAVHWRAWAADPRDGELWLTLLPSTPREGPTTLLVQEKTRIRRSVCTHGVLLLHHRKVRKITSRPAVSRGPSVFSMNASQAGSFSMEKVPELVSEPRFRARAACVCCQVMAARRVRSFSLAVLSKEDMPAYCWGRWKRMDFHLFLSFH